MEAEKTVFHNEKLRITFTEKGRYMHQTWWGSTTDLEFEVLLDRIVEILTENKVNGLILDAREHKGLGPSAQALAARRIGQYATDSGQPFKQAVIVPKDVFSKFSVTNYTKKLDEYNPVTNRFFDDVAKAKEWMEE